MKFTVAATASLLAIGSTAASADSPSLSIPKRGSPVAPNGYAPAVVDCPSTRPAVRSALRLSQNEQEWLQKRRSNTVSPLRDFLTRMNIAGFDASAWMNTHQNNISAIPNIGIAASGGGYRALMNGAGAVSAFDLRTPGTTGKGQLGGLLQSATYLAGLSGGGWLVGSLFLNNFTGVDAILGADPEYSSVWGFQNSIFQGPTKKKGFSILSSVGYFQDLLDAVEGKSDAGYDTSITDYWGRALSYQLINATNGGIGYTFSSIAQDSAFSKGNTPMPILVADGRAPGQRIFSTNTTVFEFNPWEMGSFDPTLFGFVPLQYLGSNFSAGVLPNNEKCVAGFDNAGFVMGTSSSLFNQILLNFGSPDVPPILENALKAVLQGLDESDNDIADYTPNPFYLWNNATNPGASSKRLTLVDGGEDLQNIPLHPLIQPERNVDVIFAIDSSADTLGSGPNWPNGTALVATYDRSLSDIENGTAFPAIPDQNTFVNLGLNTRPTFFGCDARNNTGPTPLIVYLPNSPYVYYSNVSTFTMAYNISERNAIIQNGYNVATRGNGTLDANWPACVGCAILSRSFGRTNTQVPAACTQCFKQYCWDGTRNSTTPAQYEPKVVLQEIKIKSAAVSLSQPTMLAMFAAIGMSGLFSFV